MATTVGAVAGLAAWSLVVLTWMFARRGAAMRAKGIGLRGRRGGRGIDLEPAMPDGANWVSHNYAHLMEQPTLFYAVALALAVIGAGDGWSAILAWIYVASRVAHSLIQGTSNILVWRFSAFLAGTAALIALTGRLLWLLA